MPDEGHFILYIQSFKLVNNIIAPVLTIFFFSPVLFHSVLFPGVQEKDSNE